MCAKGYSEYLSLWRCLIGLLTAMCTANGNLVQSCQVTTTTTTVDFSSPPPDQPRYPLLPFTLLLLLDYALFFFFARFFSQLASKHGFAINPLSTGSTLLVVYGASPDQSCYILTLSANPAPNF